MYLTWRRQLVHILKRFGMKSVTELTGRIDLLAHLDYIQRKRLRENWIYKQLQQ